MEPIELDEKCRDILEKLNESGTLHYMDLFETTTPTTYKSFDKRLSKMEEAGLILKHFWPTYETYLPTYSITPIGEDASKMLIDAA